MKILIIEDEKALVEVLRMEFEDAQYTVGTVMDGADAVAKMKAFQPDIVLLDLLLPNKDGFEILAEMKADRGLTHIPVIILSNLGQDEDIKKAMKLGAEDYYVKAQHPVKEVVDKVKEYGVKPPKTAR